MERVVQQCDLLVKCALEFQQSLMIKAGVGTCLDVQEDRPKCVREKEGSKGLHRWYSAESRGEAALDSRSSAHCK